VVRLAEGEVEIPDHRPLRLGSMQFETGCSSGDYIRLLNCRVFFWLGKDNGPVGRSGKRHYERYAGEGPVIVLRVPLRSLMAGNPYHQLFVTNCNSGSARSHPDKTIVRGPSTFLEPAEAPFAAQKAVELTVIGICRLPAETEWSETIHGPWRQL
jgi:hypothetical protein